MNYLGRDRQGKFAWGLSSPRWVVVICGYPGLGPLTSKLPADGLGDPQNARIERRGSTRSVIICGVKSLSFVFLRHSDAPSLGSNG
jgi:hypothetical protein